MLASAGHKTYIKTVAVVGLLALVLTPWETQAAAPEPAAEAQTDASEEAALNLDQSIRGLKDEVLLFNRDAENAEEDFAYPAHTRVTIYVGVKAQGLLLDRFVLSVDEGPSKTYSYDERMAKALLRREGLQRLDRLNLDKGPHRIRAEFSGRFADAKPEEPPVTGRMEAVFNKTLNATEIELSVSRPRRGAAPALVLKEWRAAQ